MTEGATDGELNRVFVGEWALTHLAVRSRELIYSRYACEEVVYSVIESWSSAQS